MVAQLIFEITYIVGYNTSRFAGCGYLWPNGRQNGSMPNLEE